MTLEVNPNIFSIGLGHNTNTAKTQSTESSSLFGYGFPPKQSTKTAKKQKNVLQTIRTDKTYIDRNDTKFTVGKDKDGNTVIRRDCLNDDGVTGLYDTEEVRSTDGKLVSVTLRKYSDFDKNENLFDKHIFDKDGLEIKVITTLTDKFGNIKEVKERTPEEFAQIDHFYQDDIEEFKRGKYQGKEHLLPTQTNPRSEILDHD